MELLDEEDTKNLPNNRGKESVLKKLEDNGRITLTSSQEMIRARTYYVHDGLTVFQIAEKFSQSPSTIEKWCYLFGWEEARRARLIPQEGDNNSHYELEALEFRPDKILHGIESALDRELQQHLDGEKVLGLADLKTLASTVQIVWSTRKNLRPGGLKKPDLVIQNHNLDVLSHLKTAIAEKQQSKTVKKQRVSVIAATDSEFDEAVG